MRSLKQKSRGGIYASLILFIGLFYYSGRDESLPYWIFHTKKGEASLSLFLFTFLRWQSGG